MAAAPAPTTIPLKYICSLCCVNQLSCVPTLLDVALPQPTVGHYLNLLETSYLLVRLPAYAVNRTKRLIKSPKLYWGDTAWRCISPRKRNPEGLIWRTWCFTIS